MSENRYNPNAADRPEFESLDVGNHASVNITNKMDASTGKRLPTMNVMVIDAYGYQWEWTLGRRRESGGKRLYWASHIYRHPGQREQLEISAGVAFRLWVRFETLLRNHPILVFNQDGELRGAARHRGFVRFANLLLAGAKPSCTLL